METPLLTVFENDFAHVRAARESVIQQRDQLAKRYDAVLQSIDRHLAENGPPDEFRVGLAKKRGQLEQERKAALAEFEGCLVESVRGCGHHGYSERSSIE